MATQISHHVSERQLLFLIGKGHVTLYAFHTILNNCRAAKFNEHEIVLLPVFVISGSWNKISLLA